MRSAGARRRTPGRSRTARSCRPSTARRSSGHPRRAAAHVTAQHEHLVEDREDEADREQDHCDRRRVADPIAVHALIDHVGGHRRGRTGGSAQRHDPDDVEELDRSDDREEGPDPNRRAEKWQRDEAQGLPTRSAVHRCRFVQFVGDALETGEKEDDREPDVLPGDHDEQRVEDKAEIGQPQLDEPPEPDAA